MSKTNDETTVTIDKAEYAKLKLWAEYPQHISLALTKFRAKLNDLTSEIADDDEVLAMALETTDSIIVLVDRLTKTFELMQLQSDAMVEMTSTPS